jgi:ATP-dependent exoDNAse (exonuclease V) beta subunit
MSVEAEPPLRPTPTKETLSPLRQFTSFTKLTKNHAPILDSVPNPAEDEGDDVQIADISVAQVSSTAAPSKSPSRLTVAGKRLGNIVHAVFEDILKAQCASGAVTREQILDFTTLRLRADGIKVTEISDPNVDSILNMVSGALMTALPDGTRLMDIRNAFPEVPFLSHRDEAEKVAAELAADRSDTLPRGFLTGNIDAIFEAPDGIWIVDWKTNHLAGYDQEHIAEAMHHHRYGLQGYLYKQAVEAAGLGTVAGVRYIFVRAFEQGASNDGKGWVDFHVANA